VREGNLPEKEVAAALKLQKDEFPEGIPECGADGLRFGLLAYTVQGRDINLDISRVVGYRQFCNKLWNAIKFAMLHLTADKWTPVPQADLLDELATSPHLAPRDRWILSRLSATIESATTALATYQFGDAASTLYGFWLYELCDYYLELIKPVMAGDVASAAAAGGDVATAQRLARGTLLVCLELGLRLLHPLMPFVTEELWQRLPGRGLAWRADGSHPDPESIMIAPWPKALPGAIRPDVEAAFKDFQSVLRVARSLRSDADLKPSVEASVYLVVADAARRVTLGDTHHRDLMTLLRAKSAVVLPTTEGVEDGCSVGLVDETVSVYLALKGFVKPEEEIAKLTKRAAKLAADQERLAKKMGLKEYATRVSAEVRDADAAAVVAVAQQAEVIARLIAQYRSWAAEAAGSDAAAASGGAGGSA